MTSLSIVIPVYNRIDLVGYTLDSINNQTFEDYECIIIDDNSTDGTWDFLTGFCQLNKRFRCYLKPAGLPRGPSSSRNFGRSLAAGKYIHFYDSDDTLDLDFYEKCMKVMDESEAEFLAVRLRWFTSEDPVGQLSNPFTADDFINKTILRRHDIWTANIIWRRDFLSGAPGFDESLTMSEDILFAVRGMKNAKNYRFENSLCVNIRRHEHSLTYRDTPEMNVARQNSVFSAYYLIYLELVGPSQSQYKESLHYCMVRLYVSLSDLYRLRKLDAKNARRYLLVMVLFCRNKEWGLLLKALTLLPLKFLVGR